MKKSKKPFKTIENNTENQKAATKVIDQYRDIFTWRERPVSEAFIERLASDLARWAIEDDDALKLTQFIHAKGICSQTFYRWAKKHHSLGMAKDVALEAIGCRREIGAIKNKYNAKVIMSQMAKYDSSWWKLEEKRAQLRVDTKGTGNPNIVYKIVVDSYKEKETQWPENRAETVLNKQMQ